jgi:hypothetical protein
MCSVRPEARRLRRRRENRWWEKDIAGELADRDPAALLAATTRWQMSALRGLEVW